MNIIKQFAISIGFFLYFAGIAAAQTSGTDLHPSDATALDQIAFVHGGTGPFAVAGYRIGQRALKEMNLSRGSFNLEVIHKTPNEVQFSCIADGVQAATGVSVGKLNLKLRGRHIHARMPRLNPVTDSGKHIGDGISYG